MGQQQQQEVAATTTAVTEEEDGDDEAGWLVDQTDWPQPSSRRPSSRSFRFRPSFVTISSSS